MFPQYCCSSSFDKPLIYFPLFFSRHSEWSAFQFSFDIQPKIVIDYIDVLRKNCICSWISYLIFCFRITYRAFSPGHLFLSQYFATGYPNGYFVSRYPIGYFALGYYIERFFPISPFEYFKPGYLFEYFATGYLIPYNFLAVQLKSEIE